ncbi:GlxA family transcriptional regulator [Leeia oryzae]|uniref:GlxA family transcriptional regulator n=1 Tax=Leeia oryzae TaxID=356662 RepID=UPI000376DF31|nr:GlxA family transcriptional regulator [Leeia oryzae]
MSATHRADQVADVSGSAEDAKPLIRRLDAAHLGNATDTGHIVELRVGILLWPQFPLLSLAGLCDALRHAADVGDQSRQIRCSWKIIGLEGQMVTSSCGVEIPVQASITEPLEVDYVAVIGGLLPAMKSADGRYVQFLQKLAKANMPLIGICTGSFVLAYAGLMKDKTACVHAYHVGDWRAAFPELKYVTNCDYHFDGDRVTCAGGMSIVELAAELIRLHCGPDRAAKVIHQMTVTHRRSGSLISRKHALGYASTDNEKLQAAIILMEKNIAIPLEISVIARLLHTSSRQLERIFWAETECSPSDFYRKLRLKYGCWLITTSDMPISTIAYECGFSDAAHFIRHFRKLYGTPPGQLRKRNKAELPA